MSCTDLISKTLTSRTEGRDRHRGVANATPDFFASPKAGLIAPNFIASARVACPEAITALAAEAKELSLGGYFSSIGRSWVSVDNRIYLWSVSDRTFTFLDCPFGVVRHVAIVDLPSGLFADGICIGLFAVTTTTSVLYGLGLGSGGVRDAIRIAEQSFAVGLDAPLTKIVQQASTRRIFAASAAGDVLELEIKLASRTVEWQSAGTLFSGTPGLRVVGEFITNVRKSWSLSRGPLLDLVVDHDKAMLYALNADGHVEMWSIKNDDLSLVCKAENSIEALKQSLKLNAPTGAPRFTSIHVVTNPRRGSCLVAISDNHERYYFSTQVQKWDISGGQTLAVTERVPPPQAGLVWSSFSNDTFVCADRSSVFVCCIPAINQPTCPPSTEIVSTFTCTSRARFTLCYGGALDATAEYSTQLVSPPSELILATGESVLTLVRLRPVDVMLGIMNASDDAALRSAIGSLGPGESCSLLVSIAAGGCPFELSLTTRDSLGASVSGLLKSIAAAPLPEVCRRSLRILREFSEPTVNDCGNGTFTVAMSPFVSGLTVAVGRCVSQIWHKSVFDPKKRTLCLSSRDRSRAEAALRRITHFLDLSRDELWFGATEPQGCSFAGATATVTAAVMTPRLAAEIQSSRVHALYRTVSIATQISRFIAFLEDISPSVVNIAVRRTRDVANLTFKDAVDRPTKMADFGRQVLAIVVDVERESGVPNYDCLLELFDDMERECKDLFLKSDAVGNQACIELEHFKRLGDQGVRIDGVETTTMKLKAHAKSLHETGTIDRVCAQLLEMGAAQNAVELLLTAASQHTDDGAREAYASGSQHEALDAKTHLVAKAVSILERLWRLKDRSSFLELIQSPGYVWLVSPNDSITHFLLLDWLTAPRPNERNREFSRLVAHCPTRFLETYLQTHAARLGLECAEYLRYTKHDYAAASERYLYVAASPLSEVPQGGRLAYRCQRTLDALQCAKDGQLPAADVARINQQSVMLEIQQRLASVIRRYLDTNSSTLAVVVEIDGQSMTQRQACEMHWARCCDASLSGEQIFELASFYRSLGGLDVQLLILRAHQVVDQDVYASVIGDAFMTSGRDAFGVARQLLEFHDSPGFPLHIVIAHLMGRTDAKVATTLADLELVPLEQLIPALKTLSDIRSGVVTTANFMLPDSFFAVDVARVVREYADAVALGSDSRRTAPASVVHARHAQMLLAKNGLPCDTRLGAIDQSVGLETRFGRKW